MKQVRRKNFKDNDRTLNDAYLHICTLYQQKLETIRKTNLASYKKKYNFSSIAFQEELDKIDMDFHQMRGLTNQISAYGDMDIETDEMYTFEKQMTFVEAQNIKLTVQARVIEVYRQYTS